MLRQIALASAIVFSSSALAFGDDLPGGDWISFTQAEQKLAALGYANVYKLKADEGYWKAKAYKDGVRYKVILDPHSGAVINSRAKQREDRSENED